MKEWLVVDADGVRLAIGYLNSAPKILDDDMLEKLSINRKFVASPPLPDKTCKRGHNDWYLNPDERYRCRACKREHYERNKSKILARYAEKRRAAGLPVRKRKARKK